jgi:CheY-like chemotaxis protein
VSADPHELRAIAELSALLAEAEALVRRNDREIARLRESIAAGPSRARSPVRSTAKTPSHNQSLPCTLGGMPLEVLVIDDHADSVELLMRVLERWGHSFAVAHSVAEARAVAHRQRFDLLLCDYQLGDGTCCDVLADVRGRYPIHGVAITGHGDESHRLAAIAAGYGDYLVKPLSLPLLKEILDAVDARRTRTD